MYCIYLRKSRADIDAERNGINTLERHETILTTFAKEHNYKICKIYREVVSGDTIAARPQMQQLLQDIESNMWDGVLVMEVERLSRGATIDQGIIAQVFKFSDTKIITPFKTYNPNDDYDEEFFEYGLFQSRREYKAIKKRMQNGIKQSCKEGKWVYNKAPYGYERVKLEGQKGYTLKIVPDQAKIVKLIYKMYCDGVGYSTIMQNLNNMQIPGPKDKWYYSTIKGILVNPAYNGKVRRGARATVKSTENGELKSSRPRNKEYDIFDGMHDAIIDDETFTKVQDMFATHKSKPVAGALEIQNPLAGLVYCKKCGHKMIRRPQDRCRTMIICPVKECDNISTYETVLEKSVIEYLEKYLEQIKTQSEFTRCDTATLEILKEERTKLSDEIVKLKAQLDNAYDLVEQGVYSVEIFKKRSEMINTKIADIKLKNDSIDKQISKEETIIRNKNKIIPQIEDTLSVYWDLKSCDKNVMLTKIIDRIDYIKTSKTKKGGPYDNFSIVVHPHFTL